MIYNDFNRRHARCLRVIVFPTDLLLRTVWIIRQTSRVSCSLRPDRYIDTDRYTNHQPGSLDASLQIRALIRARPDNVRSDSCADYTPIEPITAPTKAQDGVIGDFLGLVTGLLGSIIKGHFIPVRSERNPGHRNQVGSDAR